MYFPTSTLPLFDRLFGSVAFEGGQDYSATAHTRNLSKLKSILMEVKHPVECMLTVDYTQKLCIDYHFKEEIGSMLCSLHEYYTSHIINISEDTSDEMFQLVLSFRLLKQAGYSVSSDVFEKYTSKQGRSRLKLGKTIPELLSLYEASQFNTGEDVLNKTTELSRIDLQICMQDLEPNAARLVKNALMNPCHKTIARYNARQYLDQCQINGYSINREVENLARYDFNLVQTLHQQEVKEIKSWWESTGIAEELKFARNQPLKWYLWSMTMIPDPHFSYCRIQMTKIIALIYVVDDIFDIYGSPAELDLFTKSINEWNLSCIGTLPTYMQVCYRTLYNITNEIAQAILNEQGFDAITSLKKMWSRLVDAFLLESRWFRSKRIPTPEEYLKNAIITSGVETVLIHTFFLLGEGITNKNVHFLESNPPLFSCPATILRLWDDLGSAKDENQDGFDGSYVECLLNQYPQYTTEIARERVEGLITKTWNKLNKECFSGNHFSPNMLTACLNTAKMVEVMYKYDGNLNLPVLEGYINDLLFKRA